MQGSPFDPIPPDEPRPQAGEGSTDESAQPPLVGAELVDEQDWRLSGAPSEAGLAGDRVAAERPLEHPLDGGSLQPVAMPSAMVLPPAIGAAPTDGGGEVAAAGRSEVQGLPARAARPRRSRQMLTVFLLGVILAAAAAVRFVGLTWDDSHHLHPDERFITMVADRIRIPASVDDYFETARSSLNPYNKEFGSYIYGTFPLFFVRGVAEFVQALTALLPLPSSGQVADFFKGWRTAASYGEITLLGRALSGIADLFTILLIFLIGQRLYGRGVGLLAALLAGFVVLSIQSAHFFTAESPLTLVVTAAFYVALRASQTTALRWWALLGVATGLAAASRITALVFLAVVLTAAWILWYRTQHLNADAPGRRFILEDVLVSLVVVGAIAAVTFRIAQPYAFAGPGFFGLAPNPKYLADLESWQRFATGQADYPPGHQWAGATPYLWQLSNLTLWGLGPPLSIAAWLGFLVAIVQVIRNPRQHHLQLLAIVWVGLNFAYWGAQFAKPMRYLLPIVPQLTIFAAFFVFCAWRWARRDLGSALTSPTALREQGSESAERTAPFDTAQGVLSQRLRELNSLRSAAAAAVTLAIVGWTVFYGLAFASIYTRPTTRVAASEWFYANVAPGSRIAVEHWDDPLPLRLAGKDAFTIFRGVEMPMYDPDTEEKRALIVSKLNEADYLVLSSNRLYGSIPKLPQRYPMTTRYYQGLFAGELGFEQVAEFTSRPSLLGIELNDDNAEEIFTVYEHPKVTIFKKGVTYSSDRVRGILESVSLDTAVRGLKPIYVRTGGLLLSQGERQDAQEGGTWSAMFQRDSLANAMPLLIWYLAVQLLGLAALPLVWYLCRRLGDAGYPLAKTVALLAIAYVPWLLASLHLAPYGRLSIGLTVLLLAVLSTLVLVTHRDVLLGALWARRRAIVGMELLFGVGFLGFAALRAANPDLWHSGYGGEKPMDFAYLNAIIKTTWFPPYDPWLSGGYINYYYFGQVIVASLTKLTGIVPWVAYNLAIPTIAALTMTGVASAVFNLLVWRGRSPRREFWALGGATAAALLAVVGGNLHEAVMLVEWLGRQVGGQGAPFDLANSRWFWNATRVITTDEPHAITEFPYFTFLYGDLHAHMIAMPFGLLVVGLAINLIRQPDWLGHLRGGGLAAHRAPDDSAHPEPMVRQAHQEWTAHPEPVVRQAHQEWNAHPEPVEGPVAPAGSVQPRPSPQLAAALGRAGHLAADLLHIAVNPSLLTLALAAVTIAVVQMTNSWDFPTYLGLVAVAIFLSEVTRPGRVWTTVVIRTLGLAALLLFMQQVFASPYTSRYALFYTGFELSRFHTTTPHYLAILGSFFAVLAVYLFFQLRALRQRLADGALGALAFVSAPTTAHSITAVDTAAPALAQPRIDPLGRAVVIMGGAAAFLAALLALAGLPVVGIALAGLAVLGSITFLRRLAPATLFTFLLVATALAVTAGVEIITVKGDIGRMNTVFKFYLQAWLFLAIAAGVLLTLMARRAWGSRWLVRGERAVLAVALGVVLGATFAYPVVGTASRLQYRFVHLPPSLDGMEFMSVARYVDKDRDLILPDDYRAINWMLDNVQGSPVIVEGLSPLYHWRSRVANFTGLPTVIGWDWHQKQQRGDFGYMVDDRVKDVEEIFNTTSPEAARRLLDKYGVQYVYVGGQERTFYPAPGIEKFDTMVGSSLDRVYNNDTVTIYRVRR